jgi:hypothetical protein
MRDVNGARPLVELVYTFPGGDGLHTMCEVPVVVGHYWIQTVPALPGLIVLDVSHPGKPVEVSRLTLDPLFVLPQPRENLQKAEFCAADERAMERSSTRVAEALRSRPISH